MDKKLIAGLEVAATARTFRTTPFVHQGRIKGVGVDCIGLPILVLKELGLGDFNQIDYPKNPDGSMLARISDVCAPVVIAPGALLVFKISVTAQHCGIVSDHFLGGYGLIHAWDVAGKVVEHKLTRDWVDKVVGCYALPGVNYG